MKRIVVSIFILIFVLIPTLALATIEDRVSLGYIYNLSGSHTEIVNSSNGNINTVSPTCLDLSLSGHLVINDIFSQEFVRNMHEQNILVTPFLSNHWSKRKATSAINNAETLSNEIVEAINKYDLDGVNIDLENLNSSDKDKLTNFIKILRNKMPEGKILSIAVAANPNKLSTTWVAAYDYEKLAKYADYLVLMAYDEHSEGGAAGPVASINFVEESVKAILEDVSRDKVVLGIPLYGRFWELNAEEGGEAIIMSQVERIANRYRNSIPRYNEHTGTATITIEVKENEKKAYVNGRYLEEGTYTIWYENETSIRRKLAVMNEYGLKGAALWAIGNEGNNFWNYYEKAFVDKDYESEASINERKYYEQLEIIKQYVDPIELPQLTNNSFDIPTIDAEMLIPKSDESSHTLERNAEISKPSFTKEKVVKEERIRISIEKHQIVHSTKRCFLKPY